MMWSGSLEDARRSLESRRLTIDVPEEHAERALEAIRRIERVESAVASRGRIEVKLKGTEGNIVLAALVEARIAVEGYSVDRLDLEAIFLERTRGIVA